MTRGAPLNAGSMSHSRVSRYRGRCIPLARPIARCGRRLPARASVQNVRARDRQIGTSAPATNKRTWRRLACGVVERGEQAGRYRGTVALNVAVPRWPWELIVLGLDVWEGCLALRGTSAFDLEDPFRRPGGWGIATDRPTIHTAEAGGMHDSTPTRWHIEFAPSLPDDATEVRIFVRPQVADLGDGVPVPDEPALVVPLRVWPLTARVVAATVSALIDPPSASSGSLNSLLVGRPVRPDRVIPVSTQIDDGTGGDLCVLAVEAWPSCFDLHVAASGWWGRRRAPRSPVDLGPPQRAPVAGTRRPRW
jgi:hypothetical protein